MVLTLYKMDASPPVRAVYMVIEKLNIPNVNYVETNLLAQDHLKDTFLRINPQHTIPHLTDGNFNLWDSHAITTYLVNKYGKNYSSLYPTDPEKRALIDLRLHFDSGILHLAVRENGEHIFFKHATCLKPEGVAKIKSAYDFTEKFLMGAQWLAGDELTLADISCVATVSTLNELLPIDDKIITRMVLTLYKMDASPPVRAVYMVMEKLNIPNVNYIETDLLANDHLKETFLKINPQHTIPHLTDGNFHLWDSHAIITYLVNKYGKNYCSLYPIDPQKRALVDRKLHFDSGILYPALRENDEPIFFGTATSLKPEGVAKIRSAYDFTEKFLMGVQWLAGDELTLADISCVATVSTLNELLPIDEKMYPNITAWIKRCSEFEFYKKGNQPGLLEFRRLLKEFLAR